MRKFFFDSEINGQSSIDDEGVALPDLPAARREALQALYGLAGEVEADAGRVHAVLRVRDEAREVLVLDMRLTLSPASVAG